MKEIICSKCGEKKNLHFNYDYSKIDLPVESIICNECGEMFYENKQEQNEPEDTYTPYCPVCDGCGEEGCCSPLNCSQSPDGSYCRTYLRDLKFGYLMHDEIMEKIYEDEEKYKDLISFYNKKFDINYDKIYKNE